MHRILFVDDDQSIREMVQAFFEIKGYTVYAAGSAQEGLDLALKCLPHCVVVDWILDNISGVDLAQKLRQESALRFVPILVISGKQITPEDMAKVIEAGADDFLAKPFNPVILAAKIQALIRRASWQSSQKIPQEIIKYRELVINMTNRTAAVAGQALNLTYTEFELLAFLVQRRGQALDRPTLIGAISERPDQVFHQVVDKHIENIRKKLGPMAESLETVRNVGYRLA